MKLAPSFAAASLLLVGLAATSTARAQNEQGAAPTTTAPPPVAQPQPVEPPSVLPARNRSPSYADYRRRHESGESRWYGWQTLIVDGGVVVGSGLSAGISGEAAATLLVGGYILGGPIVHWAHGNVGRGFIDVGLRVGAPLVLGVGGYLAAGGSERDSVGAGIAAGVGFILGVAGAIAIDAAVLAREPVNDDDDDTDEDAKYETRAHHKVASKSPFVAGSVRPVLQPRQDVPGSWAITGGTLGLSAALY